MSLRKTYKTDKKAETEGVWLTVGMFNEKPQKIKVSRMSRTNAKYTKEFERATRPYTAAIQNETLDNALAAKMLQEVFVNSVLLDWENIPKSELTGKVEDEKETLVFNKENVLALFEELPDLYDDWETLARKAVSFREAEREVAAKN